MIRLLCTFLENEKEIISTAQGRVLHMLDIWVGYTFTRCPNFLERIMPDKRVLPNLITCYSLNWFHFHNYHNISNSF